MDYIKKPKKCGRLLLLVPLLVLLIPALSACTTKLSKPKNVYRIEPLTTSYDTSEMTILNCCAAKDTIFLLMKGSGGYEILATDGKAEKTIVLDFGISEHGQCFVGAFAADGSGDLWLAAQGSDRGNDGEEHSFQRLYRCSGGVMKQITADDGYISSVEPVGDGTALILQNGVLKQVSADGVQSVIPMEDDNYSLGGILRSGSDLFVLAYTNDQNGTPMLFPIDLQKKALEKAVGGFGTGAFLSSETDGYIAFTSEIDGIYGYGYGDGDEGELDRREVVNYLSSDIRYEDITKVCPFGQNSFLVLYYEDGVQRCGILKPVPEEEITTKEIVVVAALNPGQIRSEIIAFNRQSEKYRVVLEDYSVYGDTAAQLLNAAMASKNAPDILLIGDSQNYGNMVGRKLFVDLYRFMDSDKSVDRLDYLDSILTAYETDGKLYSLPNRFGIKTFAAKKSLLDTENGFSWKDFTEYAAAHDIAMFSPAYGRNAFLEAYVRFNYASSAEVGAGTPRFDTPEFREALAFAETLADESEFSGFRDDTQYIENRVLLSEEQVRGFDSYEIMQKYTFGGADAGYVGFPDDGGNGSLIFTEGFAYEFAILQSSRHKEAAWEFVKYFLTEDAQMPRMTDGVWSSPFGFPVSKAALAKLRDIAADEANGFLTKEAADEVERLICSATQISRTDKQLCGIVTEEASAFFSGQKSMDEVIMIIENRADTLFSERE